MIYMIVNRKEQLDYPDKPGNDINENTQAKACDYLPFGQKAGASPAATFNS